MNPLKHTLRYLLITLIISPITASAFEEAATDFDYTTTDNEVTINSVSSNDAQLTIPSTIDGLPVTSLFVYALLGEYPAQQFTIPDSITDFPWNLINDSFRNLTEIVIDPNNQPFTSIDGVLFNKEATKLLVYPANKEGDYTFPDSVTQIAANAFSNNAHLTSLTLPDNLEQMDSSPFEATFNLTDLIIDQENPNFSTIDGVLYNKDATILHFCPKAKFGEYSISDSVTTIADKAFQSCYALTGINVDSNNPNYSSTDGVVFNKESTSLMIYPAGRSGEYTIPDFVNTIENQAFNGCKNLNKITIGNQVTEIGIFAFFRCTNLSTVTFGSSPTTISSYAFASCTSLTSITFPANITSIHKNAFSSCSNLTNIYFKGDTPFSWAEHVFGTSNDITIYYTSGTTGWDGRISFKIPFIEWEPTANFLYEIENDQVIITGYIEDSNAPVTIPSTIQGLPVVSINHSAFRDSQLTSVTIPSSVTDINTNAFYFSPNLSEIIVASDNPAYSSVDGVLFNKNQTELLRFPIARTGHYSIPDSATSIAIGAFQNCRIQSISISEHLTKITPTRPQLGPNNQALPQPAQSFHLCHDLESITVSPDNPNYSSVNGVLFDKDQKELILFPRAKSGEYSIPEGVTKLGDYAFNGSTLLTKLTIPSSLETLYPYSLRSCTNLATIDTASNHQKFSSIEGVLFNKEGDTLLAFPHNNTLNYTIPEGTLAIGPSAFYQSDIVHITIPEGLTHIEANAFRESTLEAIIFPSSLEIIDSTAFQHCTELHTVIFKDSPTEIQGSAFNGCTSLERLDLGTQIKSIGSFANCTSLSKVVIPDTVSELGYGAFAGCTALNYVTLTPSKTELNLAAFADNPYLVSFNCIGDAPPPLPTPFHTLPESTTVYYMPETVGWESTFLGLTTKEAHGFSYFPQNETATITGYSGYSPTITIPSTIEGLPVTSIRFVRFLNDYSIREIHIPDSLTDIQMDSLSYVDFENLSAIHVDPNNPNYTSVNGVLYNKDLTKILVYPTNKHGEHDFPETVTSFPSGLFGNNLHLKEFQIPEAIEHISSTAFSGALYLTDFMVTPNHPHFSSNDGVLFNKNGSILLRYPQGKHGAYSIPQSVVEIEYAAFSWCKGLESISIPDSVQILGTASFSNCEKLEDVTIGNGISIIENATFSNCTNLEKIHFGNSIKKIEYGAFSDCTSIVNLTFPNSLTTIDDRAFSDCTSIINLTFPNSLTSIGIAAFYQCESLEKINFGSSITSIAAKAFSGCANLTQVLLPDSITDLGGQAFYECSMLENIKLPNSIETLEWSLLGRCTSLAQVTIPPSVTTLQNSVFLNCSSLKSITIPDAVITIQGVAFSGCTQLKTIHIGKELESIEMSPSTIPSLEEINVTSSNPNFSSIDAILFDKTATTLIQYPAAKAEANFEIPATVTTIAPNAIRDAPNLQTVFIPQNTESISPDSFINCKNLTTINVAPHNTVYSSLDGVLFNKGRSNLLVFPTARSGYYTIPNTVSSIADKAFYNCTNLLGITLGDRVTDIGSGAFSGSSNLKYLNLGKSLSTIQSFAFGSCDSLESIIFPSSIQDIQSSAFAGCTNLQEIYFYGTPPSHIFSFYGGAFGNTNSLTVYHKVDPIDWGSNTDGITFKQWDPIDNYLTWISNYPEVGNQDGFNDDPDGDGKPNGLENVLGTDPSIPSDGLKFVSIDRDSFTFTHPAQNAFNLDYLRSKYLWSTDLETFHEEGTSDESGTTLYFSITPNMPTTGVTSITATVYGPEIPKKLYVRIAVDEAL